MSDPKLQDELGRLAALNRYDVLDTAPEHAFDKITSLVQAVLDVPICAVSLIDVDRQWFKSRQGLEADETARDISFCTHTIRGRGPMVIEDVARDPRFATNPLVTDAPHIGSYAGAPLRTPDGYNVGSLCAIDTRPRTFSPAQINILESFAALVVDELELRLVATRDHLTGALTRRAFAARMDEAIARNARSPHATALLMLDIDHFKSVNDRFGHPAGDRVLKRVAAACTDTLRAGDVIGRLGGEEFGMLITEADADRALAAAERIRTAIEALTFDDGRPETLTASIGVAPLEPAITAAAWTARADQALYAAKSSGRNKTILASSDGGQTP